MIRSSRSRWISGIGAAVLSGGLLVAGYGTGVPPAEATGTWVNPFPIIIEKLNQILAKLSTSGGGGNHTLRWDTNNASATRFTTAFTGAALDNNTGLVWEQAPDITGGPNSNGTRSWRAATFYCINDVTVGGTKGWRLPSVVELASLEDPANSNPALPTGHPFSNVQSAHYWSASTDADVPTGAWFVNFLTGGVGAEGKTDAGQVWCVRGGMHADQY